MVKWNRLLLITASVGLLAGCEGAINENSNDTAEEADTTTAATQVVVNDEDSLLEGLSSDGAWIVIFEEDITSEEDLVMVDGFENNNGDTERKLALYAQDADRNVTDTFTLTAPSITLQNEGTRFYNGTFVGDVYVEGERFQLVDGTIDGDLIFSSQELLDSAELDGTITGETRVEE